MQENVLPIAGLPATLQDVADRLAAAPQLPETRKRDLRSALRCYGKIAGGPLAAIPIDLNGIRERLDGMVAAQAKVSVSRWANLRTDLAAAITASGLHPMLSTATLPLREDWTALLDCCADQGIATGLSRLARWASLRQVSPKAVNGPVLERFITELETMTLVRKPQVLATTVVKTWNKLVTAAPHAGLQAIAPSVSPAASQRIAWCALPASFRREVEEYLEWCRVPDPLADDARPKALAATTRRLVRDQIHSAASAACASGKCEPEQLTSLSALLEPEMYRAILRHEYAKNGRATAYLRGMAQALVLLASEWLKVPADQLAALKKVRSKLGNQQFGLTEKNRTVLRRLEDERLQSALVQLPDNLWRNALRILPSSKRGFVDLQNALAIDILLHAPLRIENLVALKYDKHVHWPQGRGKCALIVIAADEIKNDVQLELELPLVLSNRLHAMRNEIAHELTGSRPESVFVTANGKPKSIGAVRVGIERTLLHRLGVHMTPHQFRHLAAKLILDANPGAYELVRQLLGHKSLRTTTRFYAGADTRRAGRAHAELISRLRQPKPKTHLQKPEGWKGNSNARS